MRILHIAPSAPYNDYWGYQDNLLPKYHRKLGHEVTVIVTNTMHKDGKIVIIVTHSRQVAKKADKVLTLRRGKLS